MLTIDEDLQAWRTLAKTIIDGAQAFYLVAIDGEIKGEPKLQSVYPVRSRKDAEVIRETLKKVLDTPIPDTIQ